MNEEETPKILPLSALREPTHLEIAELIMLTSQATMAMVDYLLAERDILSDEEENAAVIGELFAAQKQLSTFWLGLRINPNEPLNDLEVPD